MAIERTVTLDEPGPEYTELLELLGPVDPTQDIVWDEDQGVWLTGSYDAFREIASNPDLFQLPAANAHPDLSPPWLQGDFYMAFEGGRKKLAFLDGEEHQRMHQWWIRQLTPRQVESWRVSVIRPLVDEAIDAFADRGSAELVEELALRVPLPVILRMMDLPTDRELVERYNRVAHQFGAMRWRLLGTQNPDAALHERAMEISAEMRDVLWPFVDARRSGEGDDLISRLWRAAPELLDPPVDDDAMYANVTILFEAGISTTAGAIGEVLHLLMTRPDLQPVLREEPERIPAFVEEALRLRMPALYLHRQVTADTVFRGRELRRGDTVYVLGLTAARDPRRYGCPHQLDLSRKGVRGHFAFSFGPRHCAGHAVGRAELQEVVGAAVTRLHDLRLDPDREPPRRAGAGPRRPWHTLYARFTAEC